MSDESLLQPIDGRLGPAHWLPENRAVEMADEVVLRVLGAERVRARPSRWALAAGLVLFLGATATGFAMYALHARKSATPPVEPAPASHTERRGAHAFTEPVVPPTPAPEPEPSPPASDPTPEVAPVRGATPSVRAATSINRGDPRVMLQGANELRTQHRWREAAAAYERISLDFPSSDEAYSALVAAAALYAEHLGRPQRALRLYGQALHQRPDGPLTQEVRWGTIAAERSLGNREAERAGLAAFLAAYPDSLFRAQAEQRLKEMANTP